MKIDPEARSSMWEDLQRRRRTEIDYLQGVITGHCRPARAGRALVAPDCGTDPEGGSRG
jgi:2-dehydropantoate 2-reductase